MKSILLLISLSLAGILQGQISNPIPEPIQPSNLVFELEDYAEIPISSGQQPKARINMLREAPDGSGRQFVNDLRGKFWMIEEGDVTLYANPLIIFDGFIHTPGFGTGFGAFDFHPDFANNGKFYTSHAEARGSAEADYTPLEHNGISLQWVLTEWTATDPAAPTFEGSRREILRIDFPNHVHGVQDIQFNPNAMPGDEEYGLLYVCVGDGGSSLNRWNANVQNTSSIFSAILRIDPLGTNGPNGQYGIPDTNPFVDEEGALGEIWCYGFRNPHRISWDTEGDHKMLIGDIGEKNIEELNLGLPGHNYGWSQREGTFLYNRAAGQNLVFELPPDDSLNNYTYPVAQYDHDEGIAIVGGYVYRGTELPELYGKYLFGDIASGRLFVVEADELELGQQATITEVNFVDAAGNPTTLLEVIEWPRADLRFGIDSNNELYILTKADGKIRRLKTPTEVSTREPAVTTVSWLSPNPGDGYYQMRTPAELQGACELSVSDVQGRQLWTQQYAVSPSYLDLTTLPAGTYWVRWQVDGKSYIQQVHQH